MKSSASTSSPLVSEAVLARVVKKAKAKGARSFDVTDPLDGVGLVEQVTVLAELFASGALGAKQEVAIDALARVLRLVMNSEPSARPRGLAAAAKALLPALKTAPADVPGMFPQYSHALDMLVMWGYALDAEAFEALAPSLEGPARLGLESVRFRFGKSVPEALRPSLLEGLARTDGRYVSARPPLVVTNDGLAHASDDDIEALALRLGDEPAWRAALAAVAGKEKPLSGWLVVRLEPSQVVSAIGALSDQAVTRLDDETIGALLGHPGTAEAFTDAIDAVPDTAKPQKTLLGIVVGAKRADAGLPMPKPWPLFRSYDGWSDAVAKRLLVGALYRIHAAFPAARSHAYVQNALAAGFPDVMVALAAHPDPALVEQALERFGEGAHPESRGLLLAALGKPMPEDRMLRLDYLVARCQTIGKGKREPRWLAALDLREELDNHDVWPVVWAESRILLAFPAAKRAAAVQPALRGDTKKAHAIQLLRVLDEPDAAAGLAAALTSPTPPPPNWLDWLLRNGSLPGVASPWTRASILARLDAEARARYDDILG
ncbi:Hypothetical protein A7982_00318 [Minicystis rosea]|nr:Hypothetical protein A7982_00318 [Minicystis rosea]